MNEIRGLAETLRDYAPPSDWGSNLFAGIVYFALGDKDEAINCVEYGNVASGRETEISGVILGQMKRGKIDVAKLAGASRDFSLNEENKKDKNIEQTPSITSNDVNHNDNVDMDFGVAPLIITVLLSLIIAIIRYL